MFKSHPALSKKEAMSAITARTGVVIAASTCLVALLPSCSRHPAQLTEAPTSSVASSAPSVHASTPSKSASGLDTCQISSLPREAATTIESIRHGGPFGSQRDGIVFGNFEHHLPNQKRGYYHEYTVPTPGAKTRGTRRVITGGAPLTAPPEFYYTGDHYETFCQIGGM